MVQEGAYARTLGNFYMLVMQVVIIFVLDMWVMSPLIGRKLGRFHHQLIRQMMGKQPIWKVGESWVYPSLAAEMVEAVLEEVETYVSHRQKKIKHFIATIPIIDICLVAERRPGVLVSHRWRK